MCESDRDVKVKTEIKAGSEIKNARKEDKEYIYDADSIAEHGESNCDICS